MDDHDGNYYTTTTSLIYYILGWTIEVTDDYFAIDGQLNNQQAP